MKSDHFSEPEFQSEIAKCLRYGDETPIAARSDCSVGIVSRHLNVNEERESTLFKSACLFTAWIDTDCEGGRKALDTFTSFVSRALPCDLPFDLSEARRRSHKERTDFHLAEAEDRPLGDRIRELEESIATDKQLLESLQAEEKRQIKRDAFAGHEVRHSAQAVASRAVRGGNGNG